VGGKEREIRCSRDSNVQIVCTPNEAHKQQRKIVWGERQTKKRGCPSIENEVKNSFKNQGPGEVTEAPESVQGGKKGQGKAPGSGHKFDGERVNGKSRPGASNKTGEIF